MLIFPKTKQLTSYDHEKTNPRSRLVWRESDHPGRPIEFPNNEKYKNYEKSHSKFMFGGVGFSCRPFRNHLPGVGRVNHILRHQ